MFRPQVFRIADFSSWLSFSFLAMRLRKIFLALVVLLLANVCIASQANAVPSPVAAELLSNYQSVAPGQKVRVAVKLSMAPQYHIYANTPQEMGLPTDVKWQVPPQLSVGPLQWPPAQRETMAGSESLGYSGQLIVPAEVTVADTVKLGSKLTLKAQVSWLACSTGCQPGQAQIELTWPVEVVSQKSPNFNELASLEATGAHLSSSKSAVASPEGLGANEASPSLGTINWFSWLGALFFAFLGGLILNVMPCVFPVLSIKVLSFVEHGAQNGRRQAWWFALGVWLSFLIIAGLLLILRASGQQLGWGFQLQSPPFVALVICLFFVLALNLFGVFEVGLGLTQLGEVSRRWQHHALGSLASGFLAVIVATPCTAPFMGSAVGYSLTLPAWAALAVFTALAWGMALPYVVLASWPALLAKLPRPGQWMETFKQLMAFPMLFTAVYFIWIVNVQAGADVVAAVLTGLTLLAAAAWLYGRWGQTQVFFSKSVISALLLALLGLALAVIGAQTLGQAPQLSAKAPEVWSLERQNAALAQGQPVFIDFGAAWCLTCQMNERTVLHSEKVQQALAQHQVLFLKADWTNRDNAITSALESYGRSGVPLYVFYSGRPGAQPQILPEIITADMVIKVLQSAQSKTGSQ